MRTKRRSGFTLAEMLVVVAIIGILAAILVPAVYLGLVAAKNARIAMEVGNLAAAMEDYKRTTHGQEFARNFATASVASAHIQRKFGKYNPSATGVTAPPASLDPAETLVFWLQGYGPNPKDPLANRNVTAGATIEENFNNALFDFDKTRLVKTREVAGAGGKMIALYHYYPRDGQQVPYVYFRADAYVADPSAQIAKGTGKLTLYQPDGTATTYINPQSYQIISAGQDGDWGGNATNDARRFPSGAGYGPGDRDNITNFSEGTLGSRQ